MEKTNEPIDVKIVFWSVTADASPKQKATELAFSAILSILAERVEDIKEWSMRIPDDTFSEIAAELFGAPSVLAACPMPHVAAGILANKSFVEWVRPESTNVYTVRMRLPPACARVKEAGLVGLGALS